MGQIHFFTDLSLLTNQLNNEAFGPIDTTKYRVTSLHTASAVPKAIAVDSGQIRFQFDNANTNLLNCVLQPNNPISYEGMPIKYFIYRGIKKDSLLQSNGLINNATGDNNHLLDILHEDKDDTSETIDQKSLGLHLDDTVGYNDNDPLFKLFTTDSDFNAIQVQAGTILGEFDPAGFGFEIVLAGVAFEPHLESVRNISLDNTTNEGGHIINMANAPVAGTAEQKRFKEQITNYLDPATFWGHFRKIETLTGKVKGRDDIFTNIVAKYAFPNRVYVDARNENGFSYNFYENYPDPFEFRNTLDNTVAFQTKSYETLGWPILILEATNFDSSRNTDLAPLELKLPIGAADHLLFFQHVTQSRRLGKMSGKLAHPKNDNQFVELQPDGSNYSQKFSLAFQNVEISSGSYGPLASYQRFIIQPKNYSAIVDDETPYIGTTTYLDNLFEIKPLDQYEFIDTDKNAVAALTHQWKILDLTETRGYRTAVITGAALDHKDKATPEEQRITFFAAPVFFDYPKKYEPEKKVGIGGLNGDSFFKEYFTKNLGEPQIIKKQLQQFADTVDVLHYIKTFEGVLPEEVENYNALYAVTMTVAEYNELLNKTNSEFNIASHPVFLQLDSLQIDKDVTGEAFEEITLRLAGHDANGNNKFYIPGSDSSSPLKDLVLRSMNGQIFATPESALLEDILPTVDVVDIVIDHPVTSDEFKEIRKALAIVATYQKDFYNNIEKAMTEGVEIWHPILEIYNDPNYYFLREGKKVKQKIQIQISFTNTKRDGDTIDWGLVSGHTDTIPLTVEINNSSTSSLSRVHLDKIANVQNYINLDDGILKPSELAEQFDPKLILTAKYNPENNNLELYSPPSSGYLEEDFDPGFVFSVKQSAEEAPNGQGLKKSGRGAVDSDIRINLNPTLRNETKEFAKFTFSDSSTEIIKVNGISFKEFQIARVILHELGHVYFNIYNDPLLEAAWITLEKQIKNAGVENPSGSGNYEVYQHNFKITGTGHLKGNPTGNLACTIEWLLIKEIIKRSDDKLDKRKEELRLANIGYNLSTNTPNQEYCLGNLN